MNDAAGSRALDHDLVTGELLGQLRIDTDGEELALAARQGLLQRALDRIGADCDLSDLVLVEQRLEFTIRYGLDLRIAAPERLEQQNTQHGGQHVPDHELALAGIRFHGTRPLCACGLAPIGAIRARQTNQRWTWPTLICRKICVPRPLALSAGRFMGAWDSAISRRIASAGWYVWENPFHAFNQSPLAAAWARPR